MEFFTDFFFKTESFINNWWPWFSLWDDVFIIQFFIICTYIYIYTYSNVYYVLLYTFVNFFLLGIYLAIFQIELFTAFLWLVECSVLFVFLLLLFYVNVKGVHSYYSSYSYALSFSFFVYVYIIFLNPFSESESSDLLNVSFYSLMDNYYEALSNSVMNDLFGFSISYYFLNGVEFLFIGFLLLIGSVICVNLYLMNKNIRAQGVNNYLSVFNFFSDFTSFSFLRKQNLIKQGNSKASVKLFKKK